MKKMKQVGKCLGATILVGALLVSVVPFIYNPLGEVLAAEETEINDEEMFYSEKTVQKTSDANKDVMETAIPKATSIAINSTNFPDGKFRKYIQDFIDEDKNNVLS